MEDQPLMKVVKKSRWLNLTKLGDIAYAVITGIAMIAVISIIAFGVGRLISIPLQKYNTLDHNMMICQTDLERESRANLYKNGLIQLLERQLRCCSKTPTPGATPLCGDSKLTYGEKVYEGVRCCCDVVATPTPTPTITVSPHCEFHECTDAGCWRTCWYAGKVSTDYLMTWAR